MGWPTESNPLPSGAYKSSTAWCLLLFLPPRKFSAPTLLAALRARRRPATPPPPVLPQVAKSVNTRFLLHFDTTTCPEPPRVTRIPIFSLSPVLYVAAAPSSVSASRRPPSFNQIVPQGNPTSCGAAGPPGASHRPPEVSHCRPSLPLNHPHHRRPFPMSIRGPAVAKWARRCLLSVVVASVWRLTAVFAGVAGPPCRLATWPSGTRAWCGSLRNPAHVPGQASSWARLGPTASFGFSINF
jgi:hypothetical protein